MHRPFLAAVLLVISCTFDYQTLKGTKGPADAAPTTGDAPWSTDVSLSTEIDASLQDRPGVDFHSQDVPLAPIDAAASGGKLGTDANSGRGGAAGTDGGVSTDSMLGTGGIVRLDAGMAGGMTGAGGRVGTGGVVGTGGINSSGGALGTGGITGSGGALGTGGITGSGGVLGTGGITASGGVLGTGGTTGTGDCMTFVTTPAEFTSATTGLVTGVQNFTKTANGAAISSSFLSLCSGNYYALSDVLTFSTVGVQSTSPPNLVFNEILGAFGSIMSSSNAGQGLDALRTTFASPQSAVGVQISVDDFEQLFTVLVKTSGTAFSYQISAKQAFVGAISQCTSKIVSVEVVPPVPSVKWRLKSVTFAQ